MNMTTVPSNQLKAMQHEIESLKEHVAHWESQYNQISFVLDSTERDKETLEETITQQAEAITKYLRAVGVLSYEGTALQGIISGEWRKYL